MIPAPEALRVGTNSAPRNLAMTKLSSLLYFPAISLVLFAEAAFAHAIVVASSPTANQTVTATEMDVEVRFNSRVDRARSRVTLVAPDGASVVLPLAEGAAETLSSKATGLENGRYRLLWQTLSVDGHITHGEIPFQVKR
jgi:copper resistance protein C